MDALAALLSRRSIRKYTDEPVSDADLATILRAAMAAPTAFNQQSWRFVAVRDPEVRAALSVASKHAGMLADAPLVIVVCGDLSAERHEGAYWVQDATAALENVLTAANALGLGAVWVGVHPWEDRAAAVRAALDLPAGVEPLGSVGIGHPAETKEPAQRFDAAKVHFDRWGTAAPEGVFSADATAATVAATASAPAPAAADSAIERWLARYEDAWRSSDLAKVGRLFTNDARYYATPFSQPRTGASAIAAWWVEQGDARRKWEFERTVVASQGRTHAVRAVTHYPDGLVVNGLAEVYHNLWLVTLEDDERASEFVEYWMLER